LALRAHLLSDVFLPLYGFRLGIGGDVFPRDVRVEEKPSRN
jgi:hypothetical protein